MPKLHTKASQMVRVYVWFYRILCITFGGIFINSSGKLCINKYLKYFGYFGSIVMTILNIIGFIYVVISEQMISLYKSSPNTYYVTCMAMALQMTHITTNLLYLNKNGIKFIGTFYQYEMDVKKTQIILFLIWISHIILPFITMTYALLTTNFIQNNRIYFVITISIFRICSYYAIWAVSFLTWIISLHFFEQLTQIKKTLIQLLEINSG